MTDLVFDHYAVIAAALSSPQCDMTSAALEVGASAAEVGSPLPEIMDHLEHAYASRGLVPPFEVVKALATGWSEKALERHHSESCEDPLTSLTTLAHLRTRLSDVYRGAEREGRRATERYGLLVVELPLMPFSRALETSLALLEVADSLRTIFNGEETLSQVSPRRVAALVNRHQLDEQRLTLLHALLRRSSVAEREPRMWVESLPRSASMLSWLLVELSR